MSLRKITFSILLGTAALTAVPHGSGLSMLSPAMAQQGPVLHTIDSQFAFAAELYANEQWAESGIAFEAFLASHTGSRQAAGARFFLGEAWVQQSNFEKAFPVYKRFVLENPHHEFTARATFRLGESAMQIGKDNEAIRTLEQFAKTWPKDELIEFALPYLGQLRLKRGEPQLAKAAYETGLQLYPKSAFAVRSHIGLAKSLQMLGDTAQANQHFQFVIDHQQGVPNLVAQSRDSHLVGEAQLQLGINAFNQNDFDQAAIFLSEAMNNCAGSKRFDAVYWLARAEMANENHVAGVELVSSIVAAMPEHPVSETIGSIALFDGAISATKIDRSDLACIWLNKLRTSYPENRLADDAFRIEIGLHHQNGRTQKVIDMFTSIADSDPQDAVYQNAGEMAARTQYAQGDYADSIATLDALLVRTKPAADSPAPQSGFKRSTWLYLKSLGQLGLKQYEEADLTLVAAEQEPVTEELKPLIELARANSFFGREQYENAAPNYQSFLMSSPSGEDAVRAACEMTVCYAELGQWHNASDAFEVVKGFESSDLVVQTTQYVAQKALDAEEKWLAQSMYSYLASSAHPPKVVARSLAGLAMVNMEKEHTPATEAIFTRLVNDHKDTKFAQSAVLKRAKFLDDQGDVPAAVMLYGVLADRFADSDIANTARLRRAHLLQKLGGKHNLKLARDLLKEQLQYPETENVSDAALYQLGWVLTDLRDTDAAQARFARLVEQFPDSQYWPDAAFRVASQQLQTGSQPSARALADGILNHPHTSDALMSRALMFKCQQAAKDHDWAQVTELMRPLHEQNSDEANPALHAKVTYWLAESLYQQQLFNESSQLFASIIDDVTIDEPLQPWVSLRLAQCLGKLKRWNDALQVAKDGLAQFGSFDQRYEFSYVIARGLESQGLLDRAMARYQAIVDFNRSSPSETAAIAQWRIGEIHFHREEYSAAIESYAKVDALQEHAQWRRAAMLQAGKCQEHLGNLKHATTLYTQLVAQFPLTEMATQAKERLQLIDRQAQKLTTEKRR